MILPTRHDGAEGRLRVLLVEDNPRDVILIKHSLSRSENHCDVDHVRRMKDLVPKVHQHRSDIVLLDLFLPDSSGIETIRRAREDLPDLPIVVLTSLDDDATARNAVREGAQDYWVKGELDPKPLLRSLRMAIERKTFENLLMSIERSHRSTSLSRLAAGVGTQIHDPASQLLGFLEEVRKQTDRLDEMLDTLHSSSGSVEHDDPRGDFASPSLEQEEMFELVTRLESLLKQSSVGVKRICAVSRELAGLAGTASGEAEWLDVCAVVRQITEQFVRYAPEGTISLDLKPVPLIAGARRKLGKAIAEVLLNALQSGQAPAKAQHRVHVRSGFDDDRLWIEIQDSGIGFTPEVKTHALEPFYTTRPQGIGLGLTLATEILREHGGNLRVDSEAGMGTRVELLIPKNTGLLPADSCPAQDDSHPIWPSVEPARVLVVAQDALTRNALARIVELRHRVVQAQSGGHAIDLILEDAAFDVIVVGAQMDDGEAAELYERIAGLAPELCARVVFLPSPEVTASEVDFISHSHARVLKRPIMADDLLLAIDAVAHPEHH